MTDTIHSLIVVLEQNERVDDTKGLMDAIRCLRGVLRVDGVVADLNTHVAMSRAKRELSSKLMAILYPD